MVLAFFSFFSMFFSKHVDVTMFVIKNLKQIIKKILELNPK